MIVGRHPSWCQVALALWIAAGSQSLAQTEDTPTPEPARRAYVVREHLRESLVPSRVEGQMYVPMARDQFEEKLRVLQRNATEAAAGDAKLMAGVYFAKYVDGQLLDGKAGVEVVNKNSANSVLSFAPCRLPIRQLRWAGRESGNVTAGVGSTGDYVAFVDRSSRLLFSWSLRHDVSQPLDAEAEGANFTVILPPCSINQLVIDLPTHLVPVVDGGDVRLITDDFADPEVVPAEVDEDSNRWIVALGGTHQFTLRVVNRAAAASRQQTRLRQTTTYRLSTSAIEIQAELTLTFSQTELHQLVLETDPTLRVARVRIGERELLPDQITRGAKPGQIVLTFDAPLKGASRKLIVDALSPLLIGRPLKLPTLRPLNLAWEQASASLEMPETLVLKKLVCRDAVETRVEAGTDGTEIHHFRLYSPTADCEVVIGRPPTRIAVHSGTAVAVSRTTLTAQIVADVHSIGGNVYVLDATVAAPWNVDSVESTPVDALVGTPARRIMGRRIRMQLRQPVTDQEKVRILIKARRAMPPRAELHAADFRIVKFGNVVSQRPLVSLRAEAPFHLMGNPQLQTDVEEITDEDRELLGPFTSGLDYIDDGSNDAFRVSLTRDKPRYAGQLDIEAMVDSDVLRQAIRIRCQPEASPISNLLVRLSPAPDVPFTWTTDEPNGVHSARLIKAAEADDAATWEIQLRQKRTTPFHVTAVCSSPLQESASIYLASLPDAVDQSGTVTVGAVDGTTLTLLVDGLTAVPIVRPDQDEYSFQRAAYRYDPTRQQAIAVARHAGPRQSSLAWAWAGKLVSRFETNGLTSHRIEFKIQNHGRPQAEITLPATATVDRVLVNDVEVSYAKSTNAAGSIAVQLPARVRFPAVCVDYTTRGQPLRDFASPQISFPQIDLACLKRSWDVWLPPGIHAHQDDRFVTAPIPALGWVERLFGSSIMRRDERPFDLFSWSDWQTIGRTASAGAGTTASMFMTAMTNVATATETPDTTNEQLTWGQVVDRYDNLTRQPRTDDQLATLLIDADALRDAGVSASTPYPMSPPRSTSQHLARHGLAVVADPESILLTSVARLGDFNQEQLTAVDGNVFITSQIEPPAASERRVSPRAWLTAPEVTRDPWFRSASSSTPEYSSGWRHYRMRLADSAEVQFTVYRPAMLRVVGWGLFFVMIAAVVWISQRRVRTLAVILTAVILTLLVPLPWLPLARGLLWGSLCGLLLTFLRDGSIRAVAATGALPAPTLSLARTTLVLLIALAAWRASADDTPSTPTPAADLTIYRVVIPVDAKQEPVGNIVYVPTELFYSLHRPVETEQGAKWTWLLRSAVYDTSLAPRGDAEGLVEAEVAASVELETFQMDTTVTFALGRDRVRTLKNTKLDGQVIDPVWNAAGDALEIPVARPGRHRLELTIRPVLRNDAASSGFALNVPSFAGARIKVLAATGINGIELPSTLGAVAKNESLSSIDADLGPADLLAVRWPLTNQTVAEKIPLTAVEHYWLRIQPSTVVLEAQFSFSVPRGGIPEVRLKSDPRLKLSQLVPSHPANYEPENGSVIVVRFDEPTENQVSVHATFLMTDTSGLGNVYPPQLSAVADLKGSRTVGLSVAPRLRAEVVADPPLQAILPAEFLADWKDAPDVPQLAYRLTTSQGPWHVSSSPQTLPIVAEQQASWSIGWASATLRFTANVDPGGQECFQQRLRVPASVEIDRLDIVRGETSTPIRWARANDIVTVFFEQAVQGPFRLELRGETRTGIREETKLPLVSLLATELQSNRLIVRQKSDVLIENLTASGFVEEEATARPVEQMGDLGAGRLAASYSLPTSVATPEKVWVSLWTRRNRPQITGRMVNYLTWEADQWYTKVRMNVNVKAGVVDELRLALPVGWSEPLTVTPEIPHSIVGSGPERVLILRPGTPIRTRLNLQIDCSTTISSSEVPLATLLSENQVEQLLVLPGRQGEEIISWETTGLKPVENLRSDGDPAADEEAPKTYRVEGARATASIHNVGRLRGTPHIQLVDIHATWNHTGHYYGVANFDVMPFQLTECLLNVPAGLSIVYINVAGGPVAWRAEDAGHFWIPLGPAQLPQRVEVVFSGRLDATPVSGQRMPAPSLKDLDVEQTLWTIYGPVGSTFDTALLEHTRTNAASQALIRAESASAALALADTLTPTTSEVGFESWKRTWEQRRDRALAVAAGSENARDVDAAAGLDFAAQNLQQTVDGRAPPVRFAQRGSSTSVSLQFRADDSTGFGMRVGISLVVACLGLLLGLTRPRIRLSEWIEQSWPMLGVGAGVVWWLWFSPSVVGLAVVTLSLLVAFWPARKSRSVRS